MFFRANSKKWVLLAMRKRSWFSCFFFFAFAVSLVHSSIPHIHPEKKDKPGVSSADIKSHDHSGSHHHDSNGQDEKPSLPVFVHFSNADFIANSKYEFCAKQKLVVQAIEHVIISVKLPEHLKKKLAFRRPREHPGSRFRSSQSLRAPPNFS